MPTYSKRRESRLKNRIKRQALKTSKEQAYKKSCIHAARYGKFDVLFNPHLKPIKSIQDIRDPDDHENSLLHIACLYKQLHLVEALLTITDLFDVNLQNDDGNTALHLMITKDESYIPIIECLIKNHNASPTIRNKNGETPQFLLSFSKSLQNIPELNILLKMHTFRQKKEENVINAQNDKNSILEKVKSKISKLSPKSLLVYKQLYRDMTSNGVWLSSKVLLKIFDKLNVELNEADIRQVIGTIDANNDGHIDFDDFMIFLMMPMNEYTNNVLSKIKGGRRREKVKAFKDSIYYDFLLQTEVIMEANELEDPIRINKFEYIQMNELFGDMFGCKPDEIDFVLKTIVLATNISDDDKVSEEEDSDCDLDSEELAMLHLDKNIWQQIVNDKLKIPDKLMIKSHHQN